MSVLKVTLLLSDPNRIDDARAIRDVLARVAPYCGVQTYVFDGLHEAGEASPQFGRGVAAALWSDVVLFLVPPGNTRANAALIAFRERTGFTERFPEPELARVWVTPNGRRSLYVLGALPGAFGALALALEIGLGDPDAAQRVRLGVERDDLLVVA